MVSTLPQASADIDHPVLSTAGNDADADESAEEGCSRGIPASATPPRAAGTPSRGRTGGDAGPDSGRDATSPSSNIVWAYTGENLSSPLASKICPRRSRTLSL